MPYSDFFIKWIHEMNQLKEKYKDFYKEQYKGHIFLYKNVYKSSNTNDTKKLKK